MRYMYTYIMYFKLKSKKECNIKLHNKQMHVSVSEVFKEHFESSWH